MVATLMARLTALAGPNDSAKPGDVSEVGRLPGQGYSLCQRTRHRAWSGRPGWRFCSSPILFRWLQHPLNSGFASRLFQGRQCVATHMLEAQATPPDRFTRRQRAGDEIDTGEVMFFGHEGVEKFPATQLLTEQRTRGGIEIESATDLRRSGSMDLNQRFVIHCAAYAGNYLVDLDEHTLDCHSLRSQGDGAQSARHR